MNPSSRAVLKLLITMSIWGSTFVVTKHAITMLPPLELAFVRVALGAIVLMPFAWRRYRDLERPSIPWRSIVELGAVGVAFYYIAFNSALTYTTAAQGALVQSCIPAVTALIAVLWLGERAQTHRWIGIGLSVIGVIVVFAGSSTVAAKQAAWGNLLMFGTVLAWGAYTALAKRAANCDTVILTAGLIVIGAVLLLPFAIWEYANGPAGAVSASGLIAIAYLGFGASGVAYLLYNSALRDMDATQAGTFTNLIPVIGVLSGLLLGDSLSVWAFVGGVLVAIGVWLTTSRANAL